MERKPQPLDEVIWINREELIPNDYNPNKVAPTELKLLKISITEDGWTQPIVINPDMTIVDGFHRWTVSGHKEIFALTNGMVPTVMLKKYRHRTKENGYHTTQQSQRNSRSSFNVQYHFWPCSRWNDRRRNYGKATNGKGRSSTFTF